MGRASSIGTRIRERRILKEFRQTELAKMAGISPAYLNLIEHNRRRIGGKLLLNIAEALDVEPSILSEGAEAALISGLQQASADHGNVDVESDRLEEFAGRFPGWAQLLTHQSAEIANLRHGVEALNDRLSHDPFLSTALHEVISTVSSIQSSASILVDSTDIEKEWRDRFQRNIFEDARRLADTSQSLVGYLDPAQDDEIKHASPLEDLDQFLSVREYSVPEFEADEQADIVSILTESNEIQSGAGHDVAFNFLSSYRAIVRRLPLDVLKAAEKIESDPAVLAKMCGVEIFELFQRLAYRSPEDGETEYGYLCVDASGATLAKRPLRGFNLPRLGGGCPVWPIYSALAQPMVPVVANIKQAGRDSEPMTAYAIAVPDGNASFSKRPRYTAHMLLKPMVLTEGTPELVGVNCRICPVTDCAARREVSILSDGF
jgi:XRE family transcriptional regulator, fatty acid utilization regulator